MALPGVSAKRWTPTELRRSVHDRGRNIVDLAVLPADSGEAIADLAVPRERPELCRTGGLGPDAVAVLATINEPTLARLRAARAAATELAWLQLVR
jgi:hypothetical protein